MQLDKNINQDRISTEDDNNHQMEIIGDGAFENLVEHFTGQSPDDTRKFAKKTFYSSENLGSKTLDLADKEVIEIDDDDRPMTSISSYD